MYIWPPLLWLLFIYYQNVYLNVFSNVIAFWSRFTQDLLFFWIPRHFLEAGKGGGGGEHGGYHICVLSLGLKSLLLVTKCLYYRQGIGYWILGTNACVYSCQRTSGMDMSSEAGKSPSSPWGTLFPPALSESMWEATLQVRAFSHNTSWSVWRNAP